MDTVKKSYETDMSFLDKIKARRADQKNTRQPIAVFLGDSVTQGCFEVYNTADGNLGCFYDADAVYHRRFAQILAMLYPDVPVGIINAGVSGDNAAGGLARLKRDVLSHLPDLCVVCFGLNDACAGLGGISSFTSSLEKIFTELRAASVQTIFLTPNLRCLCVSDHAVGTTSRMLAASFAEADNAGILDSYIEAACTLCKRLGIKICDNYKIWKLLEANGVDTTELLSNHLNHPTRDMSWIAAYELVRLLIGAQ